MAIISLYFCQAPQKSNIFLVASYIILKTSKLSTIIFMVALVLRFFIQQKQSPSIYKTVVLIKFHLLSPWSFLLLISTFSLLVHLQKGEKHVDKLP